MKRRGINFNTYCVLHPGNSVPYALRPSITELMCDECAIRWALWDLPWLMPDIGPGHPARPRGISTRSEAKIAACMRLLAFMFIRTTGWALKRLLCSNQSRAFHLRLLLLRRLVSHPHLSRLAGRCKFASRSHVHRSRKKGNWLA